MRIVCRGPESPSPAFPNERRLYGPRGKFSITEKPPKGYIVVSAGRGREPPGEERGSIMEAKKERGVPILMYHGVGPDRPGWPWNYLFTPADIFEAQMRALRAAGWKTISLGELHAHMAEGKPLPAKPVVLTFDDGYADNWIYAYPILRKYGHHAVVWMSVDFVDPRTEPRPTLEDVWAGRLREGALDPRGYLSWAEMRLMTGSGHVEIQSHAMTHTWYPCGDEILDFHRPAGVDDYAPPLWLGWNMFPARKHESMHVDLSELVPFGTPIYRNAKSLAAPRYFEDESLTEKLRARVAGSGAAAFFEEPLWREDLLDVVREHGARAGRLETEHEYRDRVRSELVQSRRAIAAALGTKVEYLCWPGGGRTPETLRIAEEAGYLATTTHFEDRARRNVRGQNPRELSRIGPGSPWVWRGRVIKRTGVGFFTANLEDFAGVKGSVCKLRFHKLRNLAGYLLSGKR